MVLNCTSVATLKPGFRLWDLLQDCSFSKPQGTCFIPKAQRSPFHCFYSIRKLHAAKSNSEQPGKKKKTLWLQPSLPDVDTLCRFSLLCDEQKVVWWLSHSVQTHREPGGSSRARPRKDRPQRKRLKLTDSCREGKGCMQGLPNPNLHIIQ